MISTDTWTRLYMNSEQIQQFLTWFLRGFIKLTHTDRRLYCCCCFIVFTEEDAAAENSGLFGYLRLSVGQLLHQHVS